MVICMVHKYQNPHIVAHDWASVSRADIYEAAHDFTKNANAQDLEILDEFSKSQLILDDLRSEPWLQRQIKTEKDVAGVSCASK